MKKFMGITEPATISSLKTKIDLFSLTLVNFQVGPVNHLEDHPLIKYCLQRNASFVTKKDGNGVERRVKGQFQRKQLCLIWEEVKPYKSKLKENMMKSYSYESEENDYSLWRLITIHLVGDNTLE